MVGPASGNAASRCTGGREGTATTMHASWSARNSVTVRRIVEAYRRGATLLVFARSPPVASGRRPSGGLESAHPVGELELLRLVPRSAG